MHITEMSKIPIKKRDYKIIFSNTPQYSEP